MKSENVRRFNQLVNELNCLSRNVTIVLDDHHKFAAANATKLVVNPIPIVFPTM